jgi:hypothetical protein
MLDHVRARVFMAGGAALAAAVANCACVLIRGLFIACGVGVVA